MGTSENASARESPPIDEDILLRWTATIMPLPLPEHYTPRGGAPLARVDDDVLMVLPPHVIVHMQRTAAQGGLQVVSPRQCPITKVMIRTPGGQRQLGDHVVGCVADPEGEWPTFDGENFEDLLPDEPLPPMRSHQVVRPKTKALPLTKSGRLLSDPVLACLVKGRAVADILRRDDVAGDGDAVIALLAKAWGVPVSMLSELDAYTLGIEGPLLRHAIKADEVYPMMHAPIHVKRCISVGVSEVTRQLLPPDSAMDWKRARVLCEAVFAMSCVSEGIPLGRYICVPPPGDPGARSDRKGVLVFQPAPASAWTFRPDSFSIYPMPVSHQEAHGEIPREVMESLSRYVSLVRPISYAMAASHRHAAKKVSAIPSRDPEMETITDGYRLMVRSLSVGAARGKTAAATVRNVIFDSVKSAPLVLRMRIARYIHIARSESATYLGLDEVPFRVIDKIARRFLAVGERVRTEVVAEAARRGSTAREWWANILSQAPERYSLFVEGTMGWAYVAMWLLFAAPTDRWTGLSKAVHYEAIKDAEVRSVGAMALPPTKGSIERLVMATRNVVKTITKTFAAYYMGVADVGLALSDEALDMGRPRTCQILREASYLWVLRSRAFRGTNISPIAHDEPHMSPNHWRVKAEPVDIVLAPAPYRAFDAYKVHVAMSEIIGPPVKKYFNDFKGVRISDCFTGLTRPILPCAEGEVTKYLCNPARLGMDFENSWEMLVEDIRKAAQTYGGGGLDSVEPPVPVEPRVFVEAGHYEAITVRRDDYYALLPEFDEDVVDWIEAALDAMPEDVSEAIYADSYASKAELLARVNREYDQYVEVVGVDPESVR